MRVILLSAEQGLIRDRKSSFENRFERLRLVFAIMVIDGGQLLKPPYTVKLARGESSAAKLFKPVNTLVN